MADHVSNNEANEEKKKRKVIAQKSDNEVREKKKEAKARTENMNIKNFN